MKVAFKQSDLNPRDFIKSAPIPVPIDKGIKIQARCLNVYNATIPERSFVRKENYDRRLVQINSMGFASQVNQPYKILGEPLYLDQKKMILHGLGQLSNAEESDHEVFHDADNDKEMTNENAKPPVSKFTFASLKKSKQLIDINSEVIRTNQFIRSVKLGHSIFNLIEEEERIKKESIDKEKRLAMEMMQVRPMEESDDELEEVRDTSCSNYQKQDFENIHESVVISKNSHNISSEKDVDFNGSEGDIHEIRKTNKSQRSKQLHSSNSVPESAVSSHFSSYVSSKRKGHKEPPKPYGLVYTSLFSNNDAPVDRNVLSRQLCVLLWLLESINVEPPNSVGPLRTCFLIHDLGGSKISDKVLHKSRAADLEWINFKKMQVAKQYSARPHQTREERIKNRRKQTSISGVNESNLTDDQSTVEDDEVLIKNTIESIPENRNEIVVPTLPLVLPHASISDNTKQETNRESIPSIHDPSLPGTAKDHSTVNNEFQSSTSRDQINATNRNIIQSARPNPRSASNKKKKPQYENESGLTKQDIQIIKIGDPDDMERVFSKGSFKNERKDAKNLRADCGPIRAYWTQAVLDYQKSLPSLMKSKRVLEIKDKFVDVTDKNSIELNNRLEEIIKRRLKSCITKFTFMDPNERGVHKMIKKMNEQINEKQRIEDMRKTPSSQFHKWYLDIEQLVEMHYTKKDCYAKLILERLANYAKLSSKKMNETKFFLTLDNLRTWEFLAPEVMSAVEFCRERILEIKPEDFDAWFQTKHPESFVARPEPPKRRVKTAID